MAERGVNYEEVILSIKVDYEKAIQGIANYNEKIDVLRTRQKQLAEDLKEGTISEGEYRKAMAATREEMKVYKEGARVLSKEIQNNIRQEKEQKDSLVALRSQLSNLTRSYDLLTKAERNSAKGKELQKKINEITTEIKTAEAETQRFYRNVGNYEGAIRNALGLNGKFATSFMGLKDAGNGNIMAGAITSVKAFGTTLLGLLTNPAFIALAGIAGAGVAFKWFYDYNKGLAEATRLTREFTGLTGAALEDVRNSIQATADTFGKDYKETLQAVDSLMSQYHLSASDAIKVINDGFVAGADLSGNMLSQIQQYGAAFHDAGIQADEMVAIIAQTRSGIFSEGGLDLIQTANNRIRTMSKNVQTSLDNIGISSRQVEKDLASGTKSTFDIIQEISAKIKTLPQDSQAVGDVLKDVFGKTAANQGLQMVEMLDTMTTKMEDVKKVTGEYGELQEEQLAANKELNDVMSALFDQSQNGFETMIMQVKIFATKWLAAAIRQLINVTNRIIDVYNNSMMVRGAVQLVAVAFRGLSAIAKSVFMVILDGAKGVAKSFLGVGEVLEGIATLSWDKIKKGVSDTLTSMPKAIAEGFRDIKKGGSDLAGAFIDGWNGTVHNKPIAHIGVASGAGDMPSGDEPVRRGGGSGSTKEAKAADAAAGKAGKAAAEKAAKERAREAEKAVKDAADAKKKEAEAIKQAEDLLLQAVEDSYEKQRQKVTQSYDHKIADIRLKLETEKNLTEKAVNAMNQSIVLLEQAKQKDLAKLSEEEMRKRIEREQKNIDDYLTTVQKGSLDEYNLKVQHLKNQRDLEIAEAENTAADEETKQARLAAIRAKYAQKQKELSDELTRSEIENIKKRFETRKAEAAGDESDPYPELTQLRIELEMRKELLDEAHKMELETDEDFLTRKLQLQKDVADKSQEIAQKETEIQVAKAQAISSAMNALTDVAEAFGDDNKELAKAAKILGLAQVAIDTGVAIAEGIRSAQAVPYPGNFAAIASTVAVVLANMATAIKTIKSAKFAHGGLVTGEGTETSDSIPARLSNGESVMTAAATRMFAPALSVMNQMGGGVAIPSTSGGEIGMELMAKAVEMGVTAMPRPVVSVEEISRVMRRVEVIENGASV